jgi:AraC family transcriptional regulator of adaptative response / DNA-3-methyladenine glycosylase II
MTLDPDACYRALSVHDPRFDGRFFVGVSSTHIYCRPICTVRLPKRENCRFFPSAAAAEVAGYRPCLRCRPELAPGNAGIDARARFAQAAVRMIEDGALEAAGVEGLASRIGVTSRHLRRVFDEEFGVSPIDYAQTQRLLLAKHLLTDTTLPVTEVALTSGFASLRRFNSLFKSRYRMPPTRFRRTAAPRALPSTLHFELAFRPPYAWAALLDFLRARAIDGVEQVTANAYRRTLAIVQHGVAYAGWLEARRAAHKPALVVEVSASLARAAPLVLARARRAFDLACDPGEIAERLGELAVGEPGLRVPGTFDGFELAVRAIVGQQISVAAARTMLGRLVRALGPALESPPSPELARIFPDATRVADAPLATLRAIGLTDARARTLTAVARQVADGTLDLSHDTDVERTHAALVAIPGVGEWTAQYIAMRALGWPDAFLAGDRIVQKALGETHAKRALARAEAWRPWRAYAVMHLWRLAK